MKSVALLLLVCLAAVAVAEFQHPPGRRIRYIREQEPKPYQLLGRSRPDNDCYFSLALPQRNLDVLEETLYRISNPKNADYGKWLTKEQVYELVGTPKETVKRVATWLKSGGDGIISMDFTGDSFMVTATCDYVERLFHTEVHVFVHTEKQYTIARHLGELSVPEELDTDIELITGITDFPPDKLEFLTPKPAGRLNPCNTPPSMRQLYNMTAEDVASRAVSQAPYAQSQGQGSPDGFGVRSLQTFQQQAGVPNNPVNNTYGSGQYTPSYDDGEANLDMEMITTFGVGAETDFFIVSVQKGWMYEYTQEFLSVTNPPIVNSMSYAWNEDQQCRNQSIPFTGLCRKLNIPNSKVYVNRTNAEFMKIMSMGHTFLAASGDGGTNGNHGGDSCAYTHPLFPAASPYVVSVGATVVVPGSSNLPGNYTQPICTGQGQMSCSCNTFDNEVVCMNINYGGFDTGGGFSYFAPRPSYQDQAVTAYLSSNITLPPSGTYNANGRGYPDVAAIGGNVAVIVAGNLQLTGGTSASTPLVAGMLSVINDMRLKVGKSTLGFVNPALYQAAQECPECFNDVTHGYNGNNCRSNMGFHATAGWDPTTGLGSINFSNLKNYLVNQLP